MTKIIIPLLFFGAAEPCVLVATSNFPIALAVVFFGDGIFWATRK